MQWILQEFEDTHKLAAALDRLGIPYTTHKVVPFVGDLIPEPDIKNPNNHENRCVTTAKGAI